MASSLIDRAKSAWNAFNREETSRTFPREDYGASYSYRPDRLRLHLTNERSVVSSVYNRIGIDVAAIDIRHSKIDKNGQFLEEINSGLNECLSTEANIDQTGRELIQDAVISLFDEGVIAIVPVDTTRDPMNTASFDVDSLRVGKIVEWYPQHVRVKLYDERTGERKDVTLPKRFVAIIENPLYQVMNEPNSTLQRLIRKLNLLDAVDEQTSSGKLDIIIQLPYVIKTEARKAQAEIRRKDIETQLAGSKYGIAYTDGTERITQLNRPAENNLMNQVEYLTNLLYSQLGITEEVFKGTADEATMLNYHNRTIEPVVAAIANEMTRTFLTKTARTQGQTIAYFRDPFKLVPISDIAEIADKFTRNEILTSNEIRGVIGFRPVDDPRANELRNKNLNQEKAEGVNPPPVVPIETGDNQNGT